MTAPVRALVSWVTATVFLLAGCPTLLERAFAGPRTPPCWCHLHHLAHAGPVTESPACHHHHGVVDVPEDVDGHGIVGEDDGDCPCHSGTPRHSNNVSCSPQAPSCAEPAQDRLLVLPSLTPLSPEEVLRIPFTSPARLIRPPRA